MLHIKREIYFILIGIFAILIISVPVLGEEVPNIEWQRCIGGSWSESASLVIPTQDGGFLIFGSTSSSDGDFVGNTIDQYHSNQVLLKIKGDGTLLWKRFLYNIKDFQESSNGDIICIDDGFNLIKLDEAGKTIWERQYSTEEAASHGNKINLTNDGGYIAIGTNTWDTGICNGIEPQIIKFDSSGNILFKEAIGRSKSTDFNIQQTPDGGYLFVGDTPGVSNYISLCGDSNATIKKFNSNGEVEWARSYGGDGFEDPITPSTLIQKSDGYTFITGTRFSSGQVSGYHGDSDIWFARTDPTGNLLQQACLGGSGTDTPLALFSLDNGEYDILGITNSFDGDLENIKSDSGKDLWFFRIDFSGAIIQQKSYNLSEIGIINEESAAKNLIKTSDGGFLLLSSSDSGPGIHGSFDYKLTKFSNDYDILWSQCYGGSQTEYGIVIQSTSDGGYILAGQGGSNDEDVGGNHGAGDIWIAKVKEGATIHPLLTSVSPDRSYSFTGDDLDITIYGTGLSSNAIFSLRKPGQPEMQPIQSTYTSQGVFECKFFMKGAIPGFWNIHVTNPDCLEYTLENCYNYIVVEPVESQWEFEEINESSSVTGLNSIIVDKSGNLHIIYQVSDPVSHLRYTWKDNTGWYSEDIPFSDLTNSYSINDLSFAMDLNGNPHFSYSNHSSISDLSKITYFKRTYSGWESEIIGDGTLSSMALDKEGYPHIAYVNQSKVMYTFFDGSNWIIEDTGIESFDDSSIFLYLDSSDYPHIAFATRACYVYCKGRIQHINKDSTGWHVSDIDNPDSKMVDKAFISFNQEKKLQVLYHTTYPTRPYYSSSDGETWYEYKILDPDYDLINTFDLALNSSNQPNIAFVASHFNSSTNQNDNLLMYEYFDGTQWRITQVDNKDIHYGQQTTSIALDKSNSPYICYPKYLNGRIKLMLAKMSDSSSLNPTIITLNPSTMIAGSDAFTLEVTGTNFVDGAKVLWEGSERPSVFVLTTKLNATILKDDVAFEGTFFVTVKNPDGNESDGFAFEVMSPLSTELLPPPTLISPGELTGPGPIINDATPSFIWNGVPGAVGYGLYIRDLDSNILVFDSQSRGITITGTEYNLPPGILENGKQYRWNMNTHSLGGWGNYSDRLYFKAPIPSTLLDPPVLQTPGNVESPGDLSDLTPTFSWVAVPGADKYGLYISDITEGEDNPDLIFNSQARGIVLEGTSYDELPLNILQKGKKYRWNMNSHNDSGWGIPNNDRFYFYTPVIEPSEIPVADFTINPPSPVADWTVVLDASESYSPNGGIITRYIWRIDNGLKFESFAPIHYYKFQDIDSHEIELTVIDETNIRSEPTTKTITVIRPVNLLSVRLTAPEKMSPWEAEEFFIDIINNGNQEIDQLFVKMEFPSEEFSLGNFYSKEGGRFYYDKENNPDYAFWLLEDIPANSHRQIRLWMTKKFFSHDSSGIIRVTVKDNYNLPNLFYPGIGWNPESEDDGETSNDRLSKAYDLDSILVRSYFETNKDISFWDSPSLKSLQFVIDLNAALHVYLAHRDIYTDKNYVNLSYPDGKNVDGSHYNIVFSHSGGTQTLYQKLKTQKITANYAVFVAPALLDTPNLTQLIRDGKVKKIFIIQSSEDILFWSHILYEEEHEFSLIPDKYSNKKPGINFQSPINTGWWGISPLVENINLENLPAQDDFWIGGDYPIHQLFSNVSVETGNPDDDHTIDIIAINNLYDPLQTLNPIHSNRVHKLLLLNLIDAYNNEQYPFDGTYPELQRVPLPESQTDSAVVCYGFAHDPNEKYGPEGHHPADEPLHYTIEYENEGDGSAFGVYVTDILDPSLDDTTINISPMYSVATGQQITERGIYFPENRTVYWDVGTVPPGEGGYANISIKFLSTVPDGTCVTNYATVYFPTAFEETQTNTIVTIKGVNIPPEIPNLTYPGNNAVDIPVNGSLLWEGHDPNNETLMYDVYYGTSTIPPLVIENTTLNMYYYSELEGNTTYYWRILAKDPYGGVTSSEISQFTTEIPYHAYFTSNITKGQAPLTVQFTDNSTGNITSRLWSFGDGAIAENVTVVTHTYTQKGTYSVNLTVSGPDGEDTMTQVIHVLPSQTVSPSYIVCWGSNISGQCDAPFDNDYIAVSGGYNHSVALRSNGSLVAWGENLLNQCTVPSGNDFISIDCGNSHNLALKSDGSLVAWGSETTVPPGIDFVAIAAGSMHSLALRENGTIVAWGYNGEGACDVPDEHDFVAIAAGRHSLALRSNGSLVAWGENSVGECNVPPGNDFIAIDANSWHSLALRSNGSVAAWGFNAFNQCNVPPGNDFKAISAGFWHSVALKENGSVVAWGYNEHGECEVPQGTAFEQISAGGWHNLALTSMNNTITVVSPNGGEVWKRGSTQTLRWDYIGDPGSSVKIEALRGEKVLATIAPSTPIGSGGSGSYNLTFPYNTPLGSDYRIRITSTSNATYTDTSDNPFTIVPPITVLSPNGDEEWQQGSTQTISWNYIGDPGPSIKIEALIGDAVIAVITPGTSVGTGGSGSMNLTLPLNTPLGTDYRIRISSPGNTTYSDTSDAPFTVIANASASISIVSPNGKEDYLQGSTQTIIWNYVGDPGSMVKLEALRGDKVLAVITPGTSIGSGGSGSYNLTFPYNTPLGSDYRIRITSTSNSAWTDMSDDPFVVSPAIELISPNGGENWVAGATYPIIWTYSGNPGPAVKIEALRGDAVLATVATSYPIGSEGAGSYNLTLPAHTPFGENYRFRITSTTYPACSDTSEDPFTISG